MLSLAEIVERLQHRKLKVVALKTGVSYMTIYKISIGENISPNKTTLMALTKYLEEYK